MDGWENYQGQRVGGTYAGILNYSPWVQSGYATVAWTMVDHNQTAANCDLAQVGWYEGAGGDRHTFIEWNGDPPSCTEVLDKNYDPYSIGDNIVYQVLYDNTPGEFTFWSNGVAIGEQSANWSNAPDDAQQFGEIKTLASQMPGGSNSDAHEDISDAHIYYSGGWNNMNGTDYNANTTDFGIYRSDNTDINIWDKACPS